MGNLAFGDKLHCEVWKSGDVWISQGLEVAVTAQSQSVTGARKQLEELYETYVQDMSTLLSRGERVSPIPRVRWYLLRRLRWWLLSLLRPNSVWVIQVSDI